MTTTHCSRLTISSTR